MQWKSDEELFTWIRNELSTPPISDVMEHSLGFDALRFEAVRFVVRIHRGASSQRGIHRQRWANACCEVGRLASDAGETVRFRGRGDQRTSSRLQRHIISKLSLLCSRLSRLRSAAPPQCSGFSLFDHNRQGAGQTGRPDLRRWRRCLCHSTRGGRGDPQSSTFDAAVLDCGDKAGGVDREKLSILFNTRK